MKGRIFLVVVISLGLFGLLGIPGSPAENSPIMSGIALDKEIPQTAAVPEKDHLILVSFSAFNVDGKTVGSIVLYDDLTTERTVDYLELYDQEGDLLAVDWFHSRRRREVDGTLGAGIRTLLERSGQDRAANKGAVECSNLH
jgi:hypothetical protein